MTPAYCGRFAPSPTGPLHFGSLVTALASFLDARHQGGQWLVRVEDIDPPREVAGATRSILRSLRHHALHWDGTVLMQSTREEACRQALDQLRDTGLVFFCDCSRPLQGDNGACVRDCASRQHKVEQPAALRVRVPAGTEITFRDGVQGMQHENLGETVSNFVVRRKDGLYAYQLAVAVDDAWQGITHVVRGADLLDSTPRQIFLLETLGCHVPDYTHIPVVTDITGAKLSKQNLADPLPENTVSNLRAALSFLGQEAPPVTDNPAEMLRHAALHWRRERVPVRPAIFAGQ